MANDPRTTLAAGCSDCGTLELRPTDPLAVLARLPPHLFNQEPGDPYIPPLHAGDLIWDDTVFGPSGGAGTPQWNLARILAEEKDHFVLGWRTAEALQHAIGNVQVVDGRLVSQCPHARHEDLDRLGAQFGVSRPLGFTDCCYWRLVHLLVFQPGSTRWRLAEIAHLFTGVRPIVTEAVARVRLAWPFTPVYAGIHGITFFDDQGFYDRDAYWVGDPSGLVTALDSYWAEGEHAEGFWGERPTASAGLRLRDAIDLARPAGVYIAYVNEPLNGRAGCKGATTRAPGTFAGNWNEAPADIAARQAAQQSAQSGVET